MNASTPIDLGHYVRKNEALDSITAHSNVFLLYTSLAFSIAVAAFALTISIWLTRYRQLLSKTGMTIHEHIKKRHEAHRAMMEWRLPALIEMLPIVVLLALLVFAAFIW